MVVIDNGSHTTRAGFSSEDLPSLVFYTNYMYDKTQNKVLIDMDEIEENPQNDVILLMEDGIISNFDNIVHNWEYVYDKIDNLNSIDPKEYPLVMNEKPWNTLKNKIKISQIVFETFQVPIFSLIKSPLAQLYNEGKSTGIVIDIGSAVVSVTPILDGIIQGKPFYSKYAGNFLNLHILNYIQELTKEKLIPNEYETATESFKNFYISNHILNDFKSLVLRNQITSYQLPNKKVLMIENPPNFLEPLFQPTLVKLPNVTIPENNIHKPNTQGLLNLIVLCLKDLEPTLLSNSRSSYSFNKTTKVSESFKNMISNILFTGGTSLSKGLINKIITELKSLIPSYFPKLNLNDYSINSISSSTENDIFDRQYSEWIGASKLATIINGNNKDISKKNIFDNWILTKSDYFDYGEDYVLEKFK